MITELVLKDTDGTVMSGSDWWKLKREKISQTRYGCAFADLEYFNTDAIEHIDRQIYDDWINLGKQIEHKLNQQDSN